MQQLPTSVITLLVLSLLFWLFRKLSSIQTSQILTDKPIEELRKKYMKYDFIQIGLLFLFTIILTFLYYNIFVSLTDFRISFLEGVLIVVRPLVAAWFLGSMFAAMFTSTILIRYIIRNKLKDDWNEYTAYNDMKYGFNSAKVGRFVMKGFALITGILIIAFFDWYTAFRQDDIVVNELFGLGEKQYHYSNIKEIRDVKKVKAPNGNIVEDEHYIIVFENGEKWNSRQSGFTNFGMDTKIIDLVKQKTGLRLTELEFDIDVLQKVNAE